MATHSITVTDAACRAIFKEGCTDLGETFHELGIRPTLVAFRRPLAVQRAIKYRSRPQSFQRDAKHPGQGPGYDAMGGLMLANKWKHGDPWPTEPTVAAFFLLKTIRTDLSAPMAKEYAVQATKAADEGKAGAALAHACEALGVPLPEHRPDGWKEA